MRMPLLPLALILSLVLTACATTPPSTPIAKGSVVSAPDGEFSLRIDHEGWSRTTPAPPDGDEDREAVLALGRDDGMSSLEAFLVIDAEPNLDSYVGKRRDSLLESGAFDYREKRRFLGDDAEHTVSTARYRIGNVVLVALTAIRAPLVVELIGFTARGQGSERELLEIMDTVRLVDREEER